MIVIVTDDRLPCSQALIAIVVLGVLSWLLIAGLVIWVSP